MNRALTADPAERFADAGAMLSALRGVRRAENNTIARRPVRDDNYCSLVA